MWIVGLGWARRQLVLPCWNFSFSWGFAFHTRTNSSQWRRKEEGGRGGCLSWWRSGRLKANILSSGTRTDTERGGAAAREFLFWLPVRPLQETFPDRPLQGPAQRCCETNTPQPVPVPLLLSWPMLSFCPDRIYILFEPPRPCGVIGIWQVLNKCLLND